jgi:hypothetical protein
MELQEIGEDNPLRPLKPFLAIVEDLDLVMSLGHWDPKAPRFLGWMLKGTSKS